MQGMLLSSASCSVQCGRWVYVILLVDESIEHIMTLPLLIMRSYEGLQVSHTLQHMSTLSTGSRDGQPSVAECVN